MSVYRLKYQNSDISYVDLALDLLVYPSGDQLVLDEEEFEALEIDGDTRRKGKLGLKVLQQLFKSVDFNNLPRLIN